MHQLRWLVLARALELRMVALYAAALPAESTTKVWKEYVPLLNDSVAGELHTLVPELVNGWLTSTRRHELQSNTLSEGPCK